MFETLSNNVNDVNNKLILFQLSMLPLALLRAQSPIWEALVGHYGPIASCSKHILVVTYLLSKWVEAFPLKSTDSVALARILVDEVICRYGVPHYPHNDQGANFVSAVIQSLCSKLGIKRTQTTEPPTRERTSWAFQPNLRSHALQGCCRSLEGLGISICQISCLSSQLYWVYSIGRSPTLPVDVMLGPIYSMNSAQSSLTMCRTTTVH